MVILCQIRKFHADLQNLCLPIWALTPRMGERYSPHAGSVLNEWISVPLVANMAENQDDNKNFWDEAKTSAKLRERFGDKADKVTAAFLKADLWKWIDFARTGNPGWEAYTSENGATMIFDDVPVLGNHHDAELLKLLTEQHKIFSCFM